MVNDADQLDIVRRIERGHGSAYSVNGREIRARDVQTLFADAATGSRSTALVSQGRIGALINAKPIDRRTIIDEAAGITGLYARRHEAELRLRAAEQNLARVQDVLVALEEQHKGLKRQARQASRYRNLSDHIRRAEAAVLALKLANAERELAEAGERLKEAEAQVADLTRLVGLATTAQAEAATALPPLRNDEAAAAAALQRLRVAHDALTAEAERVAAGPAGGRDPPAADRAATLPASAAARATPRRRSPISTASAPGSSRSGWARTSAPPPRPAGARRPRRPRPHAAETEHDRLTRQIADDEALRDSVSREIAELQERLRRLAARREEIAGQQRQIEAELAEPAGAAPRSRPRSTPRAAPSTRRAAGRSRRSTPPARPSATNPTPRARRSPRPRPSASTWSAPAPPSGRPPRRAMPPPTRALQKVNARLTKLRAEEAGVAAALKSAADSLWPPLLDALTVEPGFEKALGAAFGEELEASSDRGAPIHWLPLGPIADAPALPDGATPLGAHVKALPELARRLGLHRHRRRRCDGRRPAGRPQGPASSSSRATARCGAGTATRCAPARRRRRRCASASATGWPRSASRSTASPPSRPRPRRKVDDKKRLAGRGARGREDLRRAGARARARGGRGGAAQDRRMRARRPARPSARAQRRIAVAERAATEARDRHAEVARRTDQLRTRLAGIEQAVAEIVGDIADAEMRRTFRQARLSSISDTQADRVAAGALRARIAELRAALVEAEGNCDRLAREAAMRVERLGQIAQDHAGWSKRLADAEGQIVELDARREQIAASIAELAAKPAEIEAKRMALGEEIAKAEHNRQEAADRLAVGETRLGEADKALKQAEGELATARESRVRREGLVEQATKDRESVVERIVERLRCEPDGVLALAEVQSLEELPEMEKAEHRLERLVHERETMGAVNLRAEEEAGELEQQITGMTTERDDLVAAIGRLRQGIQSLNREGRERFLVAFEQVSGHFQQLFTKLFGGGKAELRLTESEDPLEAGLEIHASPPGKKLQVMSLLSGGEQALTALSLLFAVFMTNPAPICVLDEVDAPLDDLNVERFCALVKDIAGRTDTRFMVITHHRVTMARMDRLYGVTMAEQGVSQLVSVNLQEADRLVA